MNPLICRRSISISILALIIIVQTSACAHLTFETVDQWQQPLLSRWFAKDDGIHYYRPRPYVLITESVTATTDKKTESCVAEIKYLPDYKQEYVIIPHYWLGSVAMKPTLTDGWNLTGFDSTVDTKMPETITALASLFKAVQPGGAPPLAEAKAEGGNVRPGLYALVSRDGKLALDITSPVFKATGTGVCSTLTAPTPQQAPKTP